LSGARAPRAARPSSSFKPSPFDVVEASNRAWLERWDDESASGNAAFTAILRSYQMLMHRVDEVLRAYKLTFSRYEILAWLAAAPGEALPLSWISSVLRMPPATVTNAIDRLEADGLIRRVAHPADARTTLAEITEQGRITSQEATEELNERVYRTLELDRDQRGQVVDLLRQLRARGGEFDPDRSDEVIDKLDLERAARKKPSRRL
jgi:DNA-binding MarR family transcriptional regulator